MHSLQAPRPGSCAAGSTCDRLPRAIGTAALAREQVALLPGRRILRMAMAQRRWDDLFDGFGQLRELVSVVAPG